MLPTVPVGVDVLVIVGVGDRVDVGVTEGVNVGVKVGVFECVGLGLGIVNVSEAKTIYPEFFMKYVNGAGLPGR